MLNRVFVAGVALVGLALIGPRATAQNEDSDLPRAMRMFGDITSGQRVGGGGAADKVLYFGRNAAGDLVVTGIQALAPGGEWGETPDAAVAVMRTRASTSNGNAGPETADIALAARTGIPVFIVGEWSRPPAIWEIRREGNGAVVRAIDAAGVAGQWSPGR